MRVRISFDALRLCLLVAAGVTSGYLWRAAFESSSPAEDRVAATPRIVEQAPSPPVVRIAPHHLTVKRPAVVRQARTHTRAGSCAAAEQSDVDPDRRRARAAGCDAAADDDTEHRAAAADDQWIRRRLTAGLGQRRQEPRPQRAGQQEAVAAGKASGCRSFICRFS
jgi:hypothetical protein